MGTLLLGTGATPAFHARAPPRLPPTTRPSTVPARLLQLPPISVRADVALLAAFAASCFAFPDPCSAVPLAGLALAPEPSNALSLPTWAIHVSSVVEWVTAMALVWEYGEKSGFESWKGLSWAMVPLLGGALCACTWHFFYNSESLDILVALQAALTTLGNFTMCVAAYRIYRSSQKGSENL